MTTKTVNAVDGESIVHQLTRAAAATMLLADDGVRVMAALANGRRPLLVVDQMPPGTRSIVKRRYPNGIGGHTSVYAAEFYGCQLEMMCEDAKPVRHLEVVRDR